MPIIVIIILLIIVALKYEVIFPSEIKIKTEQYLKVKYPDEKFTFIEKINSRSGGGMIFQGYTTTKYGVAFYKHRNETVRVVYTANDYFGDIDGRYQLISTEDEIYDNLETKKVEADLIEHIKSNFEYDIYKIELIVSDVSPSAAYFSSGSYFKKEKLYSGNINSFFNNSSSYLICRIYVENHAVDSDFENKMDDLNIKLSKLVHNDETADDGIQIEWFIGDKQDLEHFKSKYPFKIKHTYSRDENELYNYSWFYSLDYNFNRETVKLDLIYMFTISYSVNQEGKYFCRVFRDGDYDVDAHDFHKNYDLITNR